MRTGINQQEKLFAQRRLKLLKHIKGEAALFVSSPLVTSSRDQHHPFRQNTDLLYFTGVNEPEVALLLLGGNRGPRSVLFLRERDPVQELWNGERIGLRRAKRIFQVDEVRDIATLEKDVAEFLKPYEVLHYGLGSNPRTDRFVTSLLTSPVGPRPGVPHTLKDIRTLTGEMRFIKDREEILLLRHAADITAEALMRIAPRLKNARSEKHAAQLLETELAALGADTTSFHTIVASGRNATELHHHPSLQPLWRQEPVLIDCGASYRGYAGDITRVFPARDSITGPARDIYLLVQSANEAAKKKAKPGITFSELHNTAVQELVKGLTSLKILKGTPASVLSSESYKAYFPHRIGHWLGLDVHDTSPLFEKKQGQPKETAWEKPLLPGNALTIEPGLYFHPSDDRVPKKFRGIGVRIEDSILITDNGCEVLSRRIPTELEEIEALCR